MCSATFTRTPLLDTVLATSYANYVLVTNTLAIEQRSNDMFTTQASSFCYVHVSFAGLKYLLLDSHV